MFEEDGDSDNSLDDDDIIVPILPPNIAELTEKLWEDSSLATN